MKTDTLFVKRDVVCEDGPTMGHMLIPEERLDGKWILRRFSTIERRWLNNAVMTSCIPDGVYPLTRRYHGRFYRKYKKDFEHRSVLEVMDVPDRTAILIHVANFEDDVHGCIGVGYPSKSIKNVGQPMIANSVPAYKIFYDLTHRLYQKHASLRLHVSTVNGPGCVVE